MVTVGVIGIGTSWETRYRPALRRLANRIRIVAVYDAIANRAGQVAAESQATAITGASALCHCDQVQAILLLEAHWCPDAILGLVCRSQKPVYIACGLGCDPDRLRSFHQAAIEEGVTLMPELGRRYTPATSRLKELIATRLGRPLQLEIDAIEPSGSKALQRPDDRARSATMIDWLDWCKYVVSAHPKQVTSPTSCDQALDSADRTIRVEFERTDTGGNDKKIEASAVVRLRFQPSVPASTRLQVRCQKGSAVIESSTHICWQTDAGPKTESLHDDRAEVDVMLDHFCRRVVGGLIPVADVNDVCRSLVIAQAAEESRASGRPVKVEG